MWVTIIGCHLAWEPTASPVLTKCWNLELTLTTNFGSHAQMVTKFGGQNLVLYQTAYLKTRHGLSFFFYSMSTLFLCCCMQYLITINHFDTLRPRQNGRNFADDTFKCIFLNENVWIPIKISLKFVMKGPINNIPALVQIIAWRRQGDKPLSEPMMVSLPMHINASLGLNELTQVQAKL